MSDRPITSKDLHAALSRIAASMQDAAAELNAADGALGDGDLGITVSRGFAEAAAVELPDDIGLAFMECAKAMQRVSSSSYGTLLATAAMSAAKATKGRSEISTDEIAGLVEGALAAMMARGKASLGDNTVLDVLDAAAAAVRRRRRANSTTGHSRPHGRRSSSSRTDRSGSAGPACSARPGSDSTTPVNWLCCGSWRRCAAEAINRTNQREE